MAIIDPAAVAPIFAGAPQAYRAFHKSNQLVRDVAKVYEANEEDPDSNSRVERQPPRQLAQTRLAGERRVLASLNENLKQQWGNLNAARHLDFFGRKIRQAAERSERSFRATIQAFIAESNPAILGKKAQGKLAKGAPLLKVRHNDEPGEEFVTEPTEVQEEVRAYMAKASEPRRANIKAALRLLDDEEPRPSPPRTDWDGEDGLLGLINFHRALRLCKEHTGVGIDGFKCVIIRYSAAFVRELYWNALVNVVNSNDFPESWQQGSQTWAKRKAETRRS